VKERTSLRHKRRCGPAAVLSPAAAAPGGDSVMCSDQAEIGTKAAPGAQDGKDRQSRGRKGGTGGPDTHPVKHTTVRCAFCHGRGRDPFGVMTTRSLCPVCLGRRVVDMVEPLVSCACCSGTGAQPHTRLTCSSCTGKGFQTVPEPRAVCSRCDGHGEAPGSERHLSCPDCHGAGWVHVRGN
jgi:DnaJ-class molecular chaperone